MKPAITPKPAPTRALPSDVILTADDIRDLGLEEAPDDLGASWEEIIDRRNRSVGHG
jgi:hypothetical protein